jgi:hypothetical protein
MEAEYRGALQQYQPYPRLRSERFGSGADGDGWESPSSSEITTSDHRHRHHHQHRNPASSCSYGTGCSIRDDDPWLLGEELLQHGGAAESSSDGDQEEEEEAGKQEADWELQTSPMLQEDWELMEIRGWRMKNDHESGASAQDHDEEHEDDACSEISCEIMD